MVIDTSALLAILLDEPDAERLVQAIIDAEVRQLGAPSMVEAAAVMLAKKGAAGEIALDALVQRLDIDIVLMSAEAASVARRGYRLFGKGVGTPGVLNYGDCLSYGIAMASGEPLLFKGADFSRTDVLVAVY